MNLNDPCYANFELNTWRILATPLFSVDLDHTAESEVSMSVFCRSCDEERSPGHLMPPSHVFLIPSTPQRQIHP